LATSSKLTLATAHPALGDDSEHPAVNETGDVPVQAGHWHVGQLGLKF
jgi:hypothetical protein